MQQNVKETRRQAPGLPMNFNDVGPIPPPRMFSDPSNTSVMQMVNSLERSAVDSDDEDDESGSCDRCDSPHPNQQNFGMKPVTTIIPICRVKSSLEGDDAYVEDEVPAKEPVLTSTAVPLKSALKKPRMTPVSAINFNHHNSYSPSPTPSNSSHHSGTSTKPQAPQPPGHPNPYQTAPKPQISPRFTYSTYGNGPVQLIQASNTSNPLAAQKPQVT